MRIQYPKLRKLPILPPFERFYCFQRIMLLYFISPPTSPGGNFYGAYLFVNVPVHVRLELQASPAFFGVSRLSYVLTYFHWHYFIAQIMGHM